ncbi:hypothetical protein [Nocardia brasiliensis]|uniref:hypothetical protein n=1 Tax=Nocardia brasiliensis TaxID=37326 RepID=UPI002453A080|nr:hypothetical protein [Nocardia brasiliensis]
MIDVEIGRYPGGGRTFPLAFRVQFVRAWHDAVERGAKARLLREYNLTRMTVEPWLAAHERGEYTSAMVVASERSANKMVNRDRAELARLRKEVADLKKKVAKSEAAQEILGKAFELLSEINESSSSEADTIPPALMSASEYARWLERNKLS